MKIRLLIADDNAPVREGLRIMLGNSNVDVIAEASTCEEAVQLARRVEIDAMLLDINMPDGSGLDALARIKAERPGLSVVIHSDHARASYASRSQALGAAAYVVKGSNRDELLEAIHDAVGDGTSNDVERRHIEDAHGM